MVNQSSVLAWRIHGQRSLEGYSPQGHKRVGYNLATKQQSSSLINQESLSHELESHSFKM